MQRVEQHASFGGSQEVWQFTSAALGGETKFAVYLRSGEHTSELQSH